MSTTRLYPNANGINFGSDYTLIDDVTPDGDASYVVIAKGAAELFDLTDLSLPPGAFIESVTIGICAASETNGHQVTYRAILASGGSSWGNVDGISAPLYAVTNSSIYDTSIFPFTSFGGGTVPLTLSPFTGLVWTITEINGMMAGWDVELDPSPYVRPRITQLYLDVVWFVPNLFLFGSSSSAGHTNVFGRDSGSASWFLLPAANPDALWFQMFSTDYASMLPNGYSVDGKLYSFNTKGFSAPGDDTLPRFNGATKQIEAGIDKDPGQSWDDVLFNGWWDLDIGVGTPAVVWNQPIAATGRYSFYWGGSGPYYTSPQSLLTQAWGYKTGALADYTTFPKSLTQRGGGGSVTTPLILCEGLYYFQQAGYYWGVSFGEYVTNGFHTYDGLALLRFVNAGDPPDVPTRMGTGSLVAMFAPYVPALTESHGNLSDFVAGMPPVRWLTHVWVPMLLPDHIRLDDGGHTIVAANTTTCLALVTDTGVVLPAMDFPSVLTYQYGAKVFVHNETSNVFAWVLSGATIGLANTTRLSLFKLVSYDIGLGTFTWTALAELDVLAAADLTDPVGDSDALYFGYGITTDQAVYRYDIAGNSWTTESIIGMTGDEYMTTLVKLIALAARRPFQFGAVTG